MYSFRGDWLPKELKESIDAYMETGRPTGGFLEAIIDNDLRLAVGRADEINVKLLHVILGYLYNECPAGSWGFAGAAAAWIQRKHDEREKRIHA